MLSWSPEATDTVRACGAVEVSTSQAFMVLSCTYW